MDKDIFPGLVTSRLVLRRFRLSDAAVFFGYRTLPEVARYQSERWLTVTMSEAAAFVAEQAAASPFSPDSWFQLAIERRDTGVLIGDIGIHTLADVSEAEIGFTLAPWQQRQGYALEAVRAVFDWLFRERGMRRLTGIADARNTASIRLMDKLGMREAGCTDGEVRFTVSAEAWRA